MAARPASSGNSMYESFHGFFNGLFAAPGGAPPGQGPPGGQGPPPGHGHPSGHYNDYHGGSPGGHDYHGGSPGGRGPPGSYSDPPDHERERQQYGGGGGPSPRNMGGRGYDDMSGRSPHQGDSRQRTQSRNRNRDNSRDDFGGPHKPWQGEAPSRELSLGQQSTGPPPSASSSGTHTPASSKPMGPYVAVNDDNDLLDQHVAYYFKHHVDVYRRHPLLRKREGVYMLHGREIIVEWQYNPDPQKQGFLVVNDWPLRQPFADYMQQTEANAEYDKVGNNASLGNIPREQRLTFNDKGAGYSRLEAMKVAKEQAAVREKAAYCVQQGQVVPQDELIARYEKTMRAKLGRNRQTAGRQSSTGQQAASAPQLPPAAPQGQVEQSRPRGETPSTSGYPGGGSPAPAPAPSGGWPAARMPQESSPYGGPSRQVTGGGSPQGLVQPNLFGGPPPATSAPRPGGASGQRFGFT